MSDKPEIAGLRFGGYEETAPGCLRAEAEAYVLEVRCARPLDVDSSIAAEEVLHAFLAGSRRGVELSRSERDAPNAALRAEVERLREAIGDFLCECARSGECRKYEENQITHGSMDDLRRALGES